MAVEKTASDRNEPHRILIISQDAEMVRVWEELFAQRNCRVFPVATAREGVTSARVLSPALILLDVEMPDGERLNLCRELRSTTDGTLLMIDSSVKNPDLFEYHRAGVDETLSASISPMALLIKSLTWLARQEWLVPRRQSAESLT